MHSPADTGAGSFDWSSYVGFPVYSADNQELGKVDHLSRDDRAAATVIIVSSATDGQPIYRFPAEAIGVVTRTRLMIDVLSDRLDRVRLGSDLNGL